MSEQLSVMEPEIRTKAASIGFAVIPKNWAEGWSMAQAFAASALVPKAYQGKPEDVIVAMQYGGEINLPPMAALQSIAVINGRPGVYGDGFLAVIQASPAYVKHVEYYELADGTKVDGLRPNDYSVEDVRAVSKFWRRGIAEPFVGTFSIGDARRAKLWGKEGPWQSNPARMLKWRARGYAGRDAFAAELRGIKSAEELQDIPELEDELPAESRSIVAPMRRSEKARAAPPPVEATPTDEAAPAAPPAASTTAAPPAPVKPKDAPTPHITNHLGVTQTFYETPINVEPFYEIRARVMKEGLAPINYVFLTHDQIVYEQALSAEGAKQTFQFTWHHGKRKDTGEPCKVLDAITAASE